MPGSRKAKTSEAVPCFSSVTNLEERQREYLERRERLRRVLMNRRAKSTKDTNESGPESPTQENLNDASNHEDEPTSNGNFYKVMSLLK